MSGHVHIQVSQSVTPLCVKLAPKTSDRTVPFRQVIMIINIAHINIGLCCSEINYKSDDW